MGKRLYIGNLSYETTESELRDLFGRSGTVVEAKVIVDRATGRSRGFAFVEMSTDSEANQAISQLNGGELGGQALKVRIAEERSGASSGRAGTRRW